MTTKHRSTPGAVHVAASRLVLGLALVLVLVLASPAGARSTTRQSELVKSAHVAFETCAARSTVVTATLLALTFAPTQPILVGVSVRNNAAKPCGSNGAPGSLLGGLGVVFGPCGNVGLQVENGSGHTVFPSPSTGSCANRSSTVLGAHRTLHSVGIWNQQIGSANSSIDAPRGQYRIIIDKKIVFTVLLVGTGGTLIPPSVTPQKPPTPGICNRVFNLIGTPAPTTTTTITSTTGTTSTTSTTTTTTTPRPKCPIGQVNGPAAGTPTPTVPPAPTTTTTTPGAARA